jgi:pilus assembly protein CpaC
LSQLRRIVIPSACVASILALSAALPAVEPALPARPAAQQPEAAGPPPPATLKPEPLLVTVGKSLIIDSPINIERISIANDTLVDAVPLNPKEVLVNGKAAGETSLIVWQKNGSRLVFELTVRPSNARLEAVRHQIARDFPDTDISITFDNETAFIRGTVKDVTAADRVKDIASTLGHVVNLLRVEVPAEDPQIVLHVRFTDVDRGATRNLGMNLASGAFNTVSALGTSFPISTDGTQSFSLSSTVNLLLFRKDINLLAAIQALEGKSLAQTLAEPNVMAINGKQASFLAGGEMPYPQVQPGAGAASVTVSFKEYGIRLNFLPTITPRGTIRLQVAPEVSQLDYSNALTLQGFVIPAIATRRVQTEVELESGQSFAIAGLLDNETTDSWAKVPGIGSIPVLGNLFKTRSMKKVNSELLILITPEIVRPFPADQPLPALTFKEPFLPKLDDFPMGQPGIGKTGPVPVHPATTSVPLEEVIQQQKQGQPAPAPATQSIAIVPVTPAPPSLNAGVTPTPMSGGGSGSGGR